ncbi:MAG TPA: rhamnogalacturonan acetylesterase, partial [Polyangiaceae bacterium]|nr:rhamnogalacturonan acetylesterase [Polyangiaceae bacterium]
GMGANPDPGAGSIAGSDGSMQAEGQEGQEAPARDGVDAPTTLQNPAAPSPASASGDEDPADTATPSDDSSAEDAPAGEPMPPATTFPVSAGKPTIYLAGDSTVQTYGPAQAPQQGWGQRIQEFFSSDVTFVNKAIGGRSSKSFIDEGRLDEIVAVIQPGDYLFAQWGINDRYRSDPARFTDPSTTFKQYLNMYIDAARSRDAIPVLVTPTPRLDFSNGAFQNGFVGYCDAIKEVGADTGTRVIDLQTKGLAYYTSIGLDEVVANVSLPPMDVLHFQANGAFQMARLVAEGVQESDLPIAQFVQ